MPEPMTTPRSTAALTAGTLASLLLWAPAAGAERDDDNWPQFRGPGARGIAAGPPPPSTWDGESGANVLWRTPIPGLGHSSPVVWGDRVFVTTAVDEESDAEGELKIGLYGDIDPVDEAHVHSFRVYALDRATGEVLWQRTAHRGVPEIQRHTKSTHANPTPATDGEVLVAFFGSEGLHAYRLDGEPLWSRDLGTLDSAFFRAPSAQWGFASSPVIADGKVIVQADVLGESFLAALDAATGRELWRTKRDDVPTWSTPTVFRHPDGDQVIVNGYRHIGGYDLATGRELWRMPGLGDIPVPTPFASGEVVYFSSSHGGGSPLYAVRAGEAKGVLDPEAAAATDEPAEEGADGEHDGEADDGASPVVWSRDRDGSYLPTPIVVGDLLFVGRDNGVLGVFEAGTGRRLLQERLTTRPGGFTSSAVAAGDRVYYTGEDGTTYVVRAAEELELLATNSLGETVLSTPAIAGGTLFFRTRGHLVAIGEETAGGETAGGEEAAADGTQAEDGRAAGDAEPPEEAP